MIKVSDYIVKRLVEHGVRHVVMVIGDIPLPNVL